ncbi:hypothetical protein NQ317_009537 [Molorchus minor]|uniref:DDE-1 domain-containing protein n=1 Tax=Molorchus minor TaxID=1323400 RepID=A0ABQ9IRM2_9CUCU|nr:hypothetical protein NQ317_009537 [Molorchus minor]
MYESNEDMARNAEKMYQIARFPRALSLRVLRWKPLMAFEDIFENKMDNQKNKEKRNYCSWTSEDMDHAITAYKENHCGFNECCRRYNIPKPTFRRHLHSLNKKANDEVQCMGRSTVFDAKIERDLAEHILRFNENKQMAGKAWYYAFMKRHNFLSLRQPEKISMARASGFNKKNVYAFFDILERCVDENGFTALTIFNVDESGFSTVQKRNQKIIAQKGKHQVGGIASGERGINTTIVCCTSAAGQCIPPMIIFKRKRMAPELAIGAPPGSIVTISDTGYINTELFVKWLYHFIEYVKPSPEKRWLLLLDGHTTHSKNLEALILARTHGVVLLQLPGHTTHRLQPLDVSFFKPMETYFSHEVEKFLRCNPGMTVSQYNMTALLSEAFAKTANISTIANGFKRSGIWPVDRTVFTESDFVAASSLLEEESSNSDVPELDNEAAPENNENQIDSSVDNDESLEENRRESVDNTQQIQTNNMHLEVSIAEICPSTPYKDQLESQQTQRKNKAKQVKKQNLTPSTSSYAIETPCSSKVTSKAKAILESNVRIEYNENDWFCFICEENLVEDMVQCLTCIAPTVELFSDDDIVEIQFEVMKTIRDIKNRQQPLHSVQSQQSQLNQQHCSNQIYPASTLTSGPSDFPRRKTQYSTQPYGYTTGPPSVTITTLARPNSQCSSAGQHSQYNSSEYIPSPSQPTIEDF